MTKTSMLAERQLNFLFNDKLNNILPPFVNLGKLGLNFGMQGVQFTATSTTAENQTLSNPMYVHSIPCNNDNQDIVSMGTNAALITKKVIDNTFDVLAIEMMSIAQAIDYIKSDKKMSPLTRKVYDHIRSVSDKFIGDSPKYKEIEKLSNYLKNNDLEF
jgi:histidine ammonia-lyase